MPEIGMNAPDLISGSPGRPRARCPNPSASPAPDQPTIRAAHSLHDGASLVCSCSALPGKFSSGDMVRGGPGDSTRHRGVNDGRVRSGREVRQGLAALMSRPSLAIGGSPSTRRRRCVARPPPVRLVLRLDRTARRERSWTRPATPPSPGTPMLDEADAMQRPGKGSCCSDGRSARLSRVSRVAVRLSLDVREVLLGSASTSVVAGTSRPASSVQRASHSA